MLRNTLTQVTTGFCQQRPCLLAASCRHYSPAERLPLDERQRRLYPQVEQEFTDEGFPLLKFKPRRTTQFDIRPKYVRRELVKYKSREQHMKEDQDWPSVWPVAKTFVPSAVPLPLRQSYERKAGAVARGKHANTELLKITNFLHLTPNAIERHCAALKRFCNPWPENLSTDEEVRAHFPVTFITRDYCNSSSSIRDKRARVVQLQVRLDDLKLADRDKTKLIELAQDRYDKNTGILTITASACPMRAQNQDYADYLLSAVYFESQNHQPWEDERFDMEAWKNINMDDYKKEAEQKLGLA